MSENKPPLIYEARNALEAGVVELEKLKLLAVLLNTEDDGLDEGQRCTFGELMADLLDRAARGLSKAEDALDGFIPDRRKGGNHEQQ